MLIILEGPDCAGKSTLAEEIREYIAALYAAPLMLKKGPPRAHPLDEYVVPLISYRPGRPSLHVICDRWHVGERVYPELLGRRSLMTAGMMRYVELFLQSRGAITVPMLPPEWTLLERYRKRGDDVISEAILPDVRELFRIEFTRLETRCGVSTDVEAVRAAIQSGQLAQYVNQFETFIGNPRPNVLLMGDIRNCGGGVACRHRVHHPANGPAFMPYPSTSGEYLFEVLTTLPERVGLANACDVDDARELWYALGRPHVVALGQRAHLELNRREVPHATVPHPQYVRRFHHHVGRRQYGELIHAVIGTERNEMKWRPSQRQPVGTSTPVR